MNWLLGRAAYFLSTRLSSSSYRKQLIIYLLPLCYVMYHSLHLPPLSSLLLDLAKNPIDLVSVGLADDSNLYDWEILIMGPDGTLFEGGFFRARLVFPSDFPNMPPTMTFISDMWHPNVYPDGKVCISILHQLPIPIAVDSPSDSPFRSVS